jgi:hypothetical protein
MRRVSGRVIIHRPAANACRPTIFTGSYAEQRMPLDLSPLRSYKNYLLN